MKTNLGFRTGAAFLLCLLSVILLVVVLEGCSRDEAVVAPNLASRGIDSDGIDPEMAAGEVMLASGWEYDQEVELPAKLELLGDKAAHCRIIDWDRQPLVNNIVRYSYTLRVGPGEYDKVRLHRVVKESRPYRPIRTTQSRLRSSRGTGKFQPVVPGRSCWSFRPRPTTEWRSIWPKMTSTSGASTRPTIWCRPKPRTSRSWRTGGCSSMWTICARGWLSPAKHASSRATAVAR